MTNEIKETVKKRIREEGITQSDLAARIGTSESALSRLLSERGTTTPRLWAALLAELRLELTTK